MTTKQELETKMLNAIQNSYQDKQKSSDNFTAHCASGVAIQYAIDVLNEIEYNNKNYLKNHRAGVKEKIIELKSLLTNK